MQAAAFLALVSCVAGQSKGDGFLILRKEVEAHSCTVDYKDVLCVVQGRETTISYSVYNVGTDSAFDVKISDDTLSEGFTLSETAAFSIGEIAA